MEIVLTVLGAVALIMAIASNATNVTNFVEARRRRRAEAGAAPAGVLVAPSPADAARLAASRTDESIAVAPAAVPAAVPPVAASPAASGAPAARRPAAPPVEPGLPARTGPAIRTPDQRLRVFVSSTLAELADERAAVRDAVTALRLSPVMFEAGARAHPPRDLYRAYLEQSDVFVGIYAARYGWVAPGEEVSGLEDEYLRCGDRPKLIYVKRVEGAREERLDGLLARIRDDDRVSYRPFRNAQELRELVADDLATLLSERFDRAGGAPVGGVAGAPSFEVPGVWGPMFGRGDEIDRVERLLDDPQVRLVTLHGPGGIGKSRLALEVAHRRRARGATVAFVGLQTVERPEAVALAVAQALGLGGLDERDAAQAVEAYLREHPALVVVDNFEQVLEAAPVLARWLERAAGLQLLVTSRAPLRLSAERGVPVGPLPLPAAGPGGDPLDAAHACPAVELFVWRARAADPSFAVTAANAATIVALVRALDGWPLAILLAAARAHHLTPEQLLARLGRGVDALGGGARDLPERQRTLRRTIDWSVGLLSPPARTLLARLSAFEGGAGLDAIERLWQASGRPPDPGAGQGDPRAGGAGLGRAGGDPDVVDLLGELLDHALVARTASDAGPRYAAYALVQEVAREALVASGEAHAVLAAHAAVVLEDARAEGPRLFVGAADALARLRLEAPNVRAALRTLRERDDVAGLAAFARALWLFWYLQGAADEHLPWLEAQLQRDDLAPRVRLDLLLAGLALVVQVRDPVRAAAWLPEAEALAATATDDPTAAVLATLARAIVASWAGDPAAAAHAAELTRAAAAASDWPWAASFAGVMLARAALARGALDEAVAHGEEAARMQAEAGDRQSEGWARLCLALAHAEAGRPDRARDEVRVALAAYEALAYHGAATVALVTAAYVAARAGDDERGARLAGAASAARRSYWPPSFEPEATIVAEGLARLAAAARTGALATAWAEGERMPLDVAVRYARGAAAAQVA